MNTASSPSQASLQPQPKLQSTLEKSGTMSLGLPKETTSQEKRIALAPSAVRYFTNNGIRVILESGAGDSAQFSDRQYSEAGAEISTDQKAIFSCDTVLKVDFPTRQEIELMKSGQLLISALQWNQLDTDLIKLLQEKKVNAMAYEMLEDESGAKPIIRAMSEMAGRASILIASELLNSQDQGKGELLGGLPGIPPTQVVVIGAGAVGEYATKTAMGLGANVFLFDNDTYRLRRIHSMSSQNLFSSTLHPQALEKAIRRADVVVGALAGKESRSPMVVSEEMVMSMKQGSVIIDVSIDKGGNFETSELCNHNSPTFEKHGVLHYCVPNIGSRYSRTASYSLSNVLAPMLDEMNKEGGFSHLLRSRAHVRKGTYLYRGNITHKQLADRCGLRYSDMDLLVGLFM